MHDDRLTTEWELDATPSQVWDVLLDVRCWPEWWRGFRDVVVLDPGASTGVGMTLHQRWRSLLPLDLDLDLRITAIERHRRLVAAASGDMEGTCTWTLHERQGRTVVEFELDARPTHLWMRWPWPLARRVIAWNAGAIMQRGGEGLATRLGPASEVRAGAPATASA